VRIVSLVPSLTELLFTLGVGDSVVAVTDYCLHPAERIARLPRVGGQKDPDLAALIALAPDLVLVAKEENLKRDVERLRAAGVRVHVTDVQTVDGALTMIAEVAALVGARAEPLVRQIAAALPPPPPSRVRALCAVWRDPWIFAGGDTYVSDVLARCGADNVIADRKRYPKLSLEEARALAPEVVILPSEPYPFSASDLPDTAKIAPGLLVDGTVLCWYGPRTARIGEIAQSVVAFFRV
jgi:ABC-type Fe3+-hydroxamate transport system substrate-binding protein